MATATNDLFLSSSGLATFGPEVVRIIELLEGCFLWWAEEFKADAMIFPPLIRVEDLNRLDYFRNFPHLGVFASRIQEGLLRNKYVEGGMWRLFLMSILRIVSMLCLRQVVTPFISICRILFWMLSDVSQRWGSVFGMRSIIGGWRGCCVLVCERLFFWVRMRR
jgi:hypothetical protein